MSDGKMKKRTKKRARRDTRIAVAAAIMRLITSDLSQDWQIKDIIEEADAKGLIPAWVLKEMMKTALTRWMSDAGRRIKKNVGTKENPKMVREFGVYYGHEQTEDGEKPRPCWRVWEQMDRDQATDALQHLFKMAENMRQEAKDCLAYVSKLEVSRGHAPLRMDDVL